MKQISITFFSGSSLQYHCLDTWNLFQVSALRLSEPLHLSSKQRSTWQEAATWQFASLKTQSFVQFRLQHTISHLDSLLINSLNSQFAIYISMLKFQVSLLSKNCFNFATIQVSQYMLNYTCKNSKGNFVSKNAKTNIQERRSSQFSRNQY